MSKIIFRHIAIVAFLSAALLIMQTGCDGEDGQRHTKELTIFHAGSLSVPFGDICKAFNALHPDIIIKAEAAGSRRCARKISDLDMRCDVMASADYKVVENLLMPDHADFNILFALNEMAIAYSGESKLADKINSANWPQILLRNDVILGRADPDSDPCGYRTLMVLQLAEKFYGITGLAADLEQKGDGRYVRPKETDLLALLESGQIDYLFIYRSVAAQHGLKMILLDDKINLKSSKLKALYNSASVKVTGKKPGEFIIRKGEPMVYSVTIPKNSCNPSLAAEWVEFLLSPQGKAIMEANGQQCLKPAKADGFDNLPEALKSFCE